MNFLKPTIFFAIALTSAFNLSALELGSQVNLSGGYRNDAISAHNTITLLTDATEKSFLRAEDIDLGEVGFNFRLTPPATNCNCDYSFLSNFYVNGSAYWGWSGKDSFEHSATSQDSLGTITNSLFSQGNQKVRTRDYKIGVGYQLYNCDNLVVGVVGGYASDRLHLKTSSGRTSVNSTPFSDDSLYNGFVYTQKWNGGWIGAELFYSYCDFLINAGYEHHFADYHAKTNVPANQRGLTANFSDTRKSHDSYGNIGYINIRQQLDDCVDVGLGFVYKHYQANHGHNKPQGASLAEIGFPEGTTASSSAKWITYSILADVGYSF